MYMHIFALWYTYILHFTTRIYLCTCACMYSTTAPHNLYLRPPWTWTRSYFTYINVQTYAQTSAQIHVHVHACIPPLHHTICICIRRGHTPGLVAYMYVYKHAQTSEQSHAISQVEVFGMRKERYGWAEKQRRAQQVLYSVYVCLRTCVCVCMLLNAKRTLQLCRKTWLCSAGAVLPFP
jgi:hypothetical protein